MELLVGALLVLALVAIAIRFGLGGSTEPRRLPRIVDDSIGMWVLRRVTGRPLLGRPAGDRPDPLARFRRPSTVLATRVPPPRRRGARPPGPSARSAPVAARVRAAPAATAAASTTDPAGRTPDGWQVVPRRPAGRSFGSSILPTAEPVEPRRASRAMAVVGYLGLAIVVAILAFIVGAAFGAASTPTLVPGASGPSSGGSGVLGSQRPASPSSTSTGPVPTNRQP